MMQKLPFDISYYNYLKILINFDTNSISKISNLNNAISFYTENMSILDDAVRKLLKYCSNDKSVVQNIEEFYKEQINIYLDKWFLSLLYK
jgi:GTP1/Obg family GTP-binding protein